MIGRRVAPPSGPTVNPYTVTKVCRLFREEKYRDVQLKWIAVYSLLISSNYTLT